MKIYYYINPLTHRTIKSTGKVYKTLKEKKYHLQKDKCLYNSKYAEKCVNRLFKKYPEFKNQITPIPPTTLINNASTESDDIHTLNELNYIHFIKKKYPYILKDPLHTHLKETYNMNKKSHSKIPLGFILNDNMIIGYIDIIGKIHKFNNPFPLNQHALDFPFILTLSQDDHTYLINIVNKGIVTDSTPFQPKEINDLLDDTLLEERIKVKEAQLAENFNKILDQRLLQLEEHLKNKYESMSKTKIQQIENKHKNVLQKYIQQINILKTQEPSLDVQKQKIELESKILELEQEKLKLKDTLTQTLNEQETEKNRLQSEYDNKIKELEEKLLLEKDDTSKLLEEKKQLEESKLEYEKELKETKDNLTKEYDQKIIELENKYNKETLKLKEDYEKKVNDETEENKQRIDTLEKEKIQLEKEYEIKRKDEMEKMKLVYDQTLSTKLKELEYSLKKEDDEIYEIKIQKIKEDYEQELEEIKKAKLNESNKDIEEIKKDYNILLTQKSDEILLIKKDFTEKLDNIKETYEQTIQNIEQKYSECRQRIISEKQDIIKAIKSYKSKLDEFIKNQLEGHKINSKKIQEINTKLRKEKDILQKRLNELYITTQTKDKNTSTESTESTEQTSLIQKQEEDISTLNKTIIELQNEINNIKITKKQVEESIINKYKTTCVEKITKEKQTIIDAIESYNNQWLNYINNQQLDHKKYKTTLKSQLQVISKKIKELIQYKDDIFNKMKTELEKRKQDEIKQLKQDLTKAGLSQTQLKDAIAQAENDANKKYSIILSAKEKEYSDVIDNLQSEKSSLNEVNQNLVKENEELKQAH